MNDFYEWRDAPRASFAVLGDPIHHSLSPRMHRAAYKALGWKEEYVGLRVPAAEFIEAVKFLRLNQYLGLNLTVPLKELYPGLNCTTDDLANRIGAVNTLILGPEIFGYNTDAPALVATLKHRITPGSKMTILGAGGAARAAYVALSQAGYELAGWNRTGAKLREILGSLEVVAQTSDSIDLTGSKAVINTTSASLAGEVPPVRWETAGPDLLAYDISYSSSSTPFLAAATEHNLQTLDGREMLVEQGALAFELWFGKNAPRQDMMKAIL